MTQFQEVLTGKWTPIDTVNKRITKASLFDKKQEGAWNGPRKSSREGDSLWLANCGSKVDIGPKNTDALVGALFIVRAYQNRILVMMFVVSSHLHAPSTRCST